MRRSLLIVAIGALAGCGSEPPPEKEIAPVEEQKSGLEVRMAAPRTAKQEVDAAMAAGQARLDSQYRAASGDTTP